MLRRLLPLATGCSQCFGGDVKPLTEDDLKAAIEFAIKTAGTASMRADEILVFAASLTAADDDGVFTEGDLAVRFKEVKEMLPALKPWLISKVTSVN